MSRIRTKERFRASHHEEEVDSEGSWAISYGDMVTLLLCFFILFFNIQNKNEEVTQKIQKALFSKFASATPEAQKGIAEVKAKIGNTNENGVDQELLNQWGGKVYVSGEKIIIEFPNVSFFDFAKTTITPEGMKTLKAFTDSYLPYAGRHTLVVKAFTDQIKVKAFPRSRFRDNLELSAMRAISAMRTLQEKGIPLRNMRISGYGEVERKLASTPTKPQALKPHSKENAYSRKVILMIEPLTEEPNVNTVSTEGQTL